MKTRWMLLGLALCLLGSVTLAGGGKSHQAELTRPIQLGVSGGNADSPICFAGTLGCLVEADGKYYILSNNHVLSRDVNDGLTTDRITQPARLDNGCVLDASDVVAHLSYVEPISWTGTNEIDAGLAEIVSGTVDTDGTILGIGSPHPDPVPPEVGMKVTKAGRTTGVTNGTVQYVDVSIRVNYGGGRVATFVGQIAVGGGGFSRAGDSGGVILTKDLYPVALLFAGGSGLTFASPMQTVLDSLGVGVVGTGTPVDDGGGKGGGKGNGKGPKPKASTVKEKYGKSLLAKPGVRGHGIGHSKGRDVIVVFVEKDTKAVRDSLPSELDGVPVEIVETGPIVPY